MQFTINPVATMQSYQQRNIDDYVKPRAPNRPGNHMSPEDAIADQKKRDYLDATIFFARRQTKMFIWRHLDQNRLIT